MVLYLHNDNDHQGLNQTPKGGNTLGNQIPDNTGVVEFSATPIFLFKPYKSYEKSNCLN